MTSTVPNSYTRILRSSAIIGGVEVIGMVLGLIRTKFAALLIGTAGIGVLGNYTSIQGLVGTIAGLGIRNSAVREIAQALQAGDNVAAGRSITALRRVCWGTGLLGMFVMVILSHPLSLWTFGSEAYALDIAFLGVAILFANLSGGESALIQGHQRIGDLARVKLVTAVSATILTVMLYALFGMRGIVPAILGLTAVDLAAAWFYARRIPVKPCRLGLLETIGTAGGMLRLGLVFMLNGLVFSMIGWLTRVLITHDLGIEAVGIFTAAYVLSQLFVNIVTGAMAADYYPRLTSHATDPVQANRMINEQTEIGLLLALPGLLATISFAPWIIQLFYSEQFLPATELLQWFALGCLGRVVAWPLMYLMPALGQSRTYFLFETLINGFHLALIFIGLKFAGLLGVAIAYLILQPVYLCAVTVIARQLTGFHWSKKSIQSFGLFIPLVLATFIFSTMLPPVIAIITGGAVAGLTTVLCLRRFVRCVGEHHRLVRALTRIPMMRFVFGT